MYVADAKDIALQQITGSKSLATYDVGCLFTALSHRKHSSAGTYLSSSGVRTPIKEGHCMSTVHLNNTDEYIPENCTVRLEISAPVLQ
jgi:hypothetical protein